MGFSTTFERSMDEERSVSMLDSTLMSLQPDEVEVDSMASLEWCAKFVFSASITV